MYIYDPYCKVFCPNPLHDIESLWWVGIWFLLLHYKLSKLGVNTVQTHVKVVKKFSQTLFNTRTDSLRRSVLISKSALLANAKPRDFSPPVFPFSLCSASSEPNYSHTAKVTNPGNLEIAHFSLPTYIVDLLIWYYGVQE